MLVIRMQRTGRSGHAQFRVVVQDSRRTPTSGKIVASLGHFDPHTKQTSLDKEKASFYLEHGAQPSERAARLLKSEGVKLPKWVSLGTKKSGEVKNADKRRSTRPEGAPEPAPKPEAKAAEAPAVNEEPAVTEPAEPTEAAAEEPATETTETPAEEPAVEAEAPVGEPVVAEEGAEAEPAVETPEAAVETPEAPETSEESAK